MEPLPWLSQICVSGGLVGSPSVCHRRSPFAWQEGRRCCVAFSLSLHACLVGATSSEGLVGLSLYFLIFCRLWSSARFCDLGNQPVFVVRACIRMTQIPISVKRVGFPLCPWCQLFPWMRRLFKGIFKSLSLCLSIGPINVRSPPLRSNYLHF